MQKSKAILQKVIRVLARMPVLILLILTFVLGYSFSSAVSRNRAPVAVDANAAKGAGEVEQIWTCSMHPQIRLPSPGKCPICGMDLVLADESPKQSSSKETTKKQSLYACSMFCLPPQPNPGKCKICGMDMVEVDVESGADDESSVQRSLKLSPTAQKLAEIQTEPVSRKFVNAEIRMVGKIDYDETRLGYITAWVPGRLERLFVDYTGIPVKKGDHLVYLYSPELATAQTELLQALERSGTADGQGSLVNRRATDWVEDIRDKFRLWGLTDEQISEIEARGTASDYMTIFAPMGGIVIHKNAVEGMYVKTGTRIYTIADLSRVWVQLDAYESDLRWLRYGQKIEFETEAHPGETFNGRIAFIDPVLDAKTRTVKVRVNVENPDGRLKPEMFVRAIVHSKVAEGGRVVDAELAGKWISPMHPEIIKDEPGTCDVCGMPLVRAESLGYVSVETGNAVAPLVIPASAPLITGKRALVYLAVPNDPGRFEGREVALGPRAGDYYIVLDHLREGERVVVNGNFKIDSAMQIIAKPSMMNPTGGGQAPTHQHGDAPLPDTTETSLPPPRSAVAGAVESVPIPAAFVNQLEPVFVGYLQLQQALSHDEHADAIAAAKKVESAVAQVDMGLLAPAAHDAWMKEQKPLSSLSQQIATSTSLESARFGFAMLSESMIVIAKRFGSPTTLHRFHCPMAFDDRGADWLQKKEKTENPFFGSTMFRCGNLVETIAPAQSRDTDGGSNGRP
jgi:Cu(I)/Ag(I) efflux system membrane fusion protein